MLVSSMADQMFTTTAQMDNSILNVVEGKVLDIPYTKGISSTKIRKLIKKNKV